MTATALDVEFLFTLTAQVAVPRHARLVGGPQGTRVAADVTGGTFAGPRLTGTVATPGGDWVTMRANGTLQLDVRLLLVTDDGASLLMQYKGIGTPNGDGSNAVRTAPLFETGDERYAWLNDVQAVGIGVSVKGSVTYEVYALR